MTGASDFLQQAVVLHQAGQLDAAEALYHKVLESEAANPDALNLLGMIAHDRGRFAEAVAFYDGARAAKPAFADAAFNRANALVALKALKEAEGSFHAALSLDPAHIGARLNLGGLLYKAGRRDEAESQFREMLKRTPTDARGHYNLGRCLLDARRFDESEAALKRAIELDVAGIPQALTLADLYSATGRGADARALLERTLAAHPDAPEVLNALGTTLCNDGDDKAGLALYDRALGIDPHYVNAAVNRGLTMLATGELEEGWRGYARRFESGEAMFAPRPQGTPWPPWRGEPLEGKTIFVWGEQGVGDQILYAGMLPDVLARASRCIIECAPRLKPLFARSFPRAVVVSATESTAVTADGPIDFQCSSLDLGRWLRASFRGFPARSHFLQADAALVAQFADKYRALRAGGNRLVGIAWKSTSAGTGAEKTIPLERWDGILKTRGVSFISVQYGDPTAELAAARARGFDIHHDASVDPLKDLDRAAAQLAALDLVISVSNTAVHLAGALGVPTWVAVPRGRGGLWYWFTQGERSPWYASLRLFRQHLGTEVVDDLATALQTSTGAPRQP